MDEMIEVWVNGRLVNWPKKEYLDYVAWQQGFEDYDDMLMEVMLQEKETPLSDDMNSVPSFM